MNYSYISLLTNNEFMPAMVAMLSSYNKVKTSYPITVMVLPEVSINNREILKHLGANVLSISQLHPTLFTTEFKGIEEPEGRSYHTCMCKLHIFRLTQFDKLIYVDSDMIFVQNIDELFQCDCLSAVVDPGYRGIINQFNAGLMVVKPNLQTYDDLIKIMESYNHKNNWVTAMGSTTSKLDDQQILYEYFHNWNEAVHLHLDKNYNIMLSHYDWYKSTLLYNHHNIKILHMTCPLRPWKTSSLAEYFSILPIPSLSVYIWWTMLINDTIIKLEQDGFMSNELRLIEWQ